MVIAVGNYYYYTGIGVNEWKNKKVKVLCKLKESLTNMSNNSDDDDSSIMVYLCEDKDGDVKKVIESDLSPIYN